jgi:ferredoxin-NADP reductase
LTVCLLTRRQVSNMAYEARDRAQQEMALLKTQADKEQLAFEQEWRELGKLIEQDKKMKEMLKQKEKGGGEFRSDYKAEDEESLRKKIIKGNARGGEGGVVDLRRELEHCQGQGGAAGVVGEGAVVRRGVCEDSSGDGDHGH